MFCPDLGIFTVQVTGLPLDAAVADLDGRIARSSDCWEHVAESYAESVVRAKLEAFITYRSRRAARPPPWPDAPRRMSIRRSACRLLTKRELFARMFYLCYMCKVCCELLVPKGSNGLST